jgi:hypothetical protein
VQPPTDELAYYATPGPLTTLPAHAGLDGLPDDLDALRAAVQGVLLHRDWALAYGVTGDAIRLGEQQLRTTEEVLARAFELSPEPITTARAPIDRVLGICRHFTLLHTALLRRQGVPARVRCGFSNYFDRTKWYDHWITERWDGERWVRDDPQIDGVQAGILRLDFDPTDQPPGPFLTGGEAWQLARAGDVDPTSFGIFDMWGESFIGGNVLLDVACLNKVELLPWDAWTDLVEGPHAPVPPASAELFDELAALAGAGDDLAPLRDRYRADDRVRVPADLVSFVDGAPVPIHLDL